MSQSSRATSFYANSLEKLTKKKFTRRDRVSVSVSRSISRLIFTETYHILFRSSFIKQKLPLVFDTMASSTTTILSNKDETVNSSKSSPNGLNISIPYGDTSIATDVRPQETQKANTHTTFDDDDDSVSVGIGDSDNDITTASKNTPSCSWKGTRMQEWTDKNISENLRFTLRVTLALTLGSLFVLCQSPNPNEAGLPDPFWVYFTAGITSFQASPDLGSVYKKTWQRFVGTIFGGMLGLGIGAISLLIPTTNYNDDDGSSSFMWHAIYLGVSQVILSFTIVYGSCYFGFRSHYSAMLGTITCGMALVAFHSSDNDNAWKTGVFRVINIIVGGIIGSLTSLIVFPVSTNHLIETKVKNLTQMTGSAVREVLETAGKDDEPSYKTLVLKPDTPDSAHDAYIKCIDSLHKVKELFPLLDYDPTFKRKTQDEKRKYVESWNLKLDRISHIQMSVVWLDNIIRSKLVGDDVLRVNLLRRVGQNIEKLFDLSSRSEKERNTTAIDMLNNDLPSIRREILRTDEKRRSRPSLTILDDPTVSTDAKIKDIGRFDDVGQANYVQKFIENQTDTFYRMVEILILRCIRQHHLN